MAIWYEVEKTENGIYNFMECNSCFHDFKIVRSDYDPENDHTLELFLLYDELEGSVILRFIDVHNMHINMDCSLGWPDDIWESVLIILENSHFLWSENYQYKEESAKHVDKLKECDYSWVECERIIWSMTDKDGNPAELPAHVIDQTWNICGKVEQHHFDLKPYTP